MKRDVDTVSISSGIPHSIQAFEDGAEFLLVFDDGAFSEDATFLLTDVWHPRFVWAMRAYKSFKC